MKHNFGYPSDAVRGTSGSTGMPAGQHPNPNLLTDILAVANKFVHNVLWMHLKSGHEVGRLEYACGPTPVGLNGI